VRAFATPKLGAYAVLGALGLLGAVALGRVEPVVLAAPFLLVLAAGLSLAERPRLDLKLHIGRERALEGDEVDAPIELTSEQDIERLELLLNLPPGLEPAPKVQNPRAIRVRASEPQTVELGFRCARWGAYRPGEIIVRACDRFGLIVHEAHLDRRRALRVYPRPEQLHELVRPLETQIRGGNQVSRGRGEGIEFADIREFAPGDRIRRVNWRASARRGVLWVNEAHPERNADVVIFLDTFGEAARGGRGTLDLTVRAAASLAERYLRDKNRVGLISFGGTLNWLLPATGLVQQYRIVDSLLESEIALSYAWKDIGQIPVRTLPPKALIVALSPLLDDRAIGALLDLRARGFDLAVFEVSPVPFAPPGQGSVNELAHRVWALQRSGVRARFLALGVPVATWQDGDPLATPLAEVTRFRRAAGSARA
jgi:uncharacterized protein (DUF58 family)